MERKQMSREGYENLQAQLNELITVQRPEIAQKLKEARSYGDLSENAEYDEAKNEQAQLEAKIQQIQYTLDHADIVEDEDINLEEVGMGTVMTIKDLETGEVEELKIVGTNEANFFENKISDESPIGKVAMKKRVGDTFIVETPNGNEIRYEVIGSFK
jgi:transcription elongation factor GreA